MANVGQPIEAVLRLNASDFNANIDKSIRAVDKFANSFRSLNSSNPSQAINRLSDAFDMFEDVLQRVDRLNKSSLNSFSRLSSAINKMANGLKILQSDAIDVEQGINTMNNIFKAFQGVLNGVEVKVKGVSTSVKELSNSEKASSMSIQQATNIINRNTQSMQLNAEAKLRSMGYSGQLNASERALASSEDKLSLSTDKATASLERQNTATKSLGRGLGMLRSGLTLVGSMLAYNFIHNLGQATTETIKAKSEMSGYFQMLGYSTGQVEHFNKALDETVAKFPRLNKYALGETISSIGVEFELTTKEMEKAMPVVSMITSEYLRAGRNVNEASLAVKDILQGEFQRLSRETGVKQDTLKEAGWSGDKTDVMGLLEALDKVGKARNWDEFVMKANSLNDAVLIMQNRFSEWASNMVSVVQPTILSVFNSLMSSAQGLAEGLTNFWQWLNDDGIGQSVVKFGALGTAILTLSQGLVMYRAEVGLVEASQLGLGKSIASVVLGLKGQEVAEVGVRNAIMGKILGVKAEALAEGGVANAIRGRLATLKSESLQQDITATKEKLKTLALEENTVAEELNTLQQDLNIASSKGLITAKEAETIQEKINTLSKEANTVATLEQEASNTGLIASLYLLGTGEAIVTGETTALSIAMGVLNGVIALSPVGWFMGVVLALAGAFYVLTGGLDASWGKMKEFHDMMKNTDDVMKPHYEYLNKLKDKVGETSEKYQKASESVTEFYESLQSAKKQYEESELDFENVGVGLKTSMKDVLEKNGISPKQVQEISMNYDALSLGKRKYYEAEQGLNRRIYDENSEFKQDLDAQIKVWQKSGQDIQAETDKLAGNYQALAEHMYIAHTTDDWWEWLWNSFYASMDQFWINWDKYWSDMLMHFKLGDFFKGANDTNFTSQLTDWVVKPLMDWLGDVDKWITDGLNALGEIDILGAIWDAILPSGVSASDGSSDHPSFMEDVSNIVGFDVQTWVTNFNSDPLGTLGIEIPQLDIWGLLSSLFGGGSDNGDGGFDIGGWLSSVFNIDGIVANFTTNLGTIFSTAQSIATNVSNVFNGLKSNIQGHLTNIVTNTSNGFENVKSNAISKMSAMRDSVGNVIHQMTDAWVRMKDSILHSAQLILDGVRSKFDSVKNTLSDFFSKLQNPASWGSAGQERWSRSPRPSTARRIFSPRSTGGRHGAGLNPYTNPSRQVKLRDLFDLVDGDNMVQLSQFLALFSDGGFGGWDFHKASLDKIYDTGKKWKTAPAHIQGIGSVGNGYQVGRFWNGRPKFTFDEFLATAEAIFSAIPYKFYYDSEWKGNWVNALLSGATNCSDGSDALIALASVFGFSGSKVHTTTKDGTGHFYAIINGRKMDTTHFQHGGGWSPLGGAGVSPRPVQQGKNVTVINDFTGATIYGVDDLDSRIKDSTKEALREEFNDPYAVPL